jgi:hypothetical protein
MVEPVDGGPLLDGIAFNVDTSIWPDNGVREVHTLLSIWPEVVDDQLQAAVAAELIDVELVG